MSNFFNELKQLFSTKDTPKEHYLTLQFENGLIQASVWELSGSNAEVVAVVVRQSENDIVRDGINSANLVISDLEEHIKGINKVIFGVPNEWVDGGAIKHEYQQFLKKLSTELALVPSGFVVSTDAISFFLSQEEGVPTTAILVNLLSDEVVVSIVKIGKIQGVVRKKITTSLPEAVCEALKEFTGVEVLPSRILIYGENSNLENAKQELISYPWLSKVVFLHFPKIDILEKLISIKAITYAGVSEIVTSGKLKFIWDEKKLNQMKQNLPVTGIEENINKPEEALNDNNLILTDNAETIKEKKEEELNEEKAEDLGFVKDQDVIKQSDNFEMISEEGFELDKEKTQEVPVVENITKTTTDNISKPKIKSAKISLPRIRISGLNFSFISGISDRFSQNSILSKIKIIPLLAILVVIFIIVSVSLYWNFVTASVRLVVVTKTVEKESEITVSKSISLIDEKKMMVPAKIIEVTEKDSAVSPTTGTKLTGEKAKGEVIIYNKTTENKNFAQGTLLTTNDGLKFIFDKQASVAAQSVSETSGGATITYGKLKTSISASTFGSKYNLSAGTSLKISDFAITIYEAKNELTLSGGSSREIAVVSKEDQVNLLKTLSEKLLVRAKTDITTKNGDAEKLVEANIESIINKQQYNAEVDSEAKDFKLDLEMKFKGTVYNDQDIKSLMEKSILNDVPDGYLYKPENAENRIEIKEIKKDGTVILKVKFIAKLVPKIDVTDIQNGLKGKSEETGRKYLELNKNISKFEFEIKPKLPKIINAFPHVPQNIKIEISSQ